MITAFRGVAATQTASSVIRRRRGLDEIDAEDRSLTSALAYWRAKRSDGLLPSPRAIDVTELHRLGADVELLASHNDDPFEPEFAPVGATTMDREAADPMRREPELDPALKRTLSEDYGSVAFTGTPAYHHLMAVGSAGNEAFGRLILPLAEDGRRVSALLVCYNRRRVTHLPA